MPDEDQNTGITETAAPETEMPLETPDQTIQGEQSPPETRSDEAETQVEAPEPKANSVGAALDAFAKSKTETGFETLAKPVTPKARDYSDLPPEMVPLFKKMGDRSFDAFKPMYLEHQKLKKEFEALKATSEQSSKASFFDHEEAYQLSPEYKHLSQNSSLLDAEINHWQQQLVNIREGKKWQPIVLDDKGNPVIGAEEDPSPRAEAYIINGLNQAHNLKIDVNNKLQGIKGTFSAQHKGFVSGLQAVEKKVFEGADQATLEKAMATKLPLFPAYLHNRPEIRALAKALAVIDGMAMLLNEKKAAATTAGIKARTQTNGGPRGGELQPGNGKATSVGAVFDEFKRAKMEGVA